MVILTQSARNELRSEGPRGIPGSVLISELDCEIGQHRGEPLRNPVAASGSRSFTPGSFLAAPFR